MVSNYSVPFCPRVFVSSWVFQTRETLLVAFRLAEAGMEQRELPSSAGVQMEPVGTQTQTFDKRLAVRKMVVDPVRDTPSPLKVGHM